MGWTIMSYYLKSKNSSFLEKWTLLCLVLIFFFLIFSSLILPLGKPDLAKSRDLCASCTRAEVPAGGAWSTLAQPVGSLLRAAVPGSHLSVA